MAENDDEGFEAIPNLDRDQHLQACKAADRELVNADHRVLGLLAAGHNGFDIRDLQTAVLLGKRNGLFDMVLAPHYSADWVWGVLSLTQKPRQIF